MLSPRRILHYGISAAIVILLVIFARTVTWEAAWDAMRNASLPLLALAILANVSSLIFRAIRWWILLRALDSPSLALSMRATVAGAGLNNVLVANGGEAARIVFVTRSSGIPSSKVLASAALDRLFDPVGFVALLVFGLVAFELPHDMQRLRLPAIIALVLITALLIWLGLKARSSTTPKLTHERQPTPSKWGGKLRAWLNEFGRSMHDLATGPRIIAMVLLTLLAWLGQLATFALAAAAAHVHLSLPGNLVALLAVNVSLIVRATPGNIGLFQFAYTLMTAPFGVPKESAVAVSFLIQTIQIIPITLLGVALAPEFLFKKKASKQA